MRRSSILSKSPSFQALFSSDSWRGFAGAFSCAPADGSSSAVPASSAAMPAAIFMRASGLLLRGLDRLFPGAVRIEAGDLLDLRLGLRSQVLLEQLAVLV